MKKDGFAISTLLYGVLAIAILILALMLSNMRSQAFLNKKLYDSLEADLSKCALKQVRLQQCARFYSEEKCSRVRSLLETCYEDQDASTGGIGMSIQKFLSEKKNDLVARLDYAGSQDQVGASSYIYYYVGNNPNNFVEYEGKQGRIISIDLKGKGLVKVLFTDDENKEKTLSFQKDNLANVPANTSGDTDPKPEELADPSEIHSAWMSNSNIILWENSNLAQYLNMEFVKKFNDSSSFYQADVPVGSFNKENNFIKGAPFVPLNPEEQSFTTYYYKFNEYNAKSSVSTLSLIDIVETSSLDSCHQFGRDINIKQCYNSTWLKNYLTWSTTPVHIKAQNITLKKKVELRKIGINEMFLTNGDVVLKNNNSIKVYPVVSFSNIKFQLEGTNVTGNGTSANPYIIE